MHFYSPLLKIIKLISPGTYGNAVSCNRKVDETQKACDQEEIRYKVVIGAVVKKQDATGENGLDDFEK